MSSRDSIIERVTVWHKVLPLTHPYALSGGRLRVEALDSTIVRVECADGLSGWGEGCPWGHTYLPAFGPGLRAAIELLVPVLIGADARGIDVLNRAMDVQLPGHLYAKSPLDIALWDIAAKRAGVPLYTLLGGADGDAVEINSSISSGTPDEMIAHIQTARDQGYRTHSAKIGGSDAALDIARINAIDAFTQDDEHVTFDVNRAWMPATAIEVMNSVTTQEWFEQPCDTLTQCESVAHNTTQKIMLDECLHTFDDHLRAWRQAVCQGVKVKPNRLGGITKARQVRDFGVSVGWQMHVEDLGGTVLADTAAMHLAWSTPAPNRLASWLSHAHLTDDYLPGQGARAVGGHIQLAPEPGLGIAPPEDWLGEPFAVHVR
ncbi:MAG: mandelate racemase/muconate lactonizing enzyme family protein [Pseudomonadota bacterium]